MPDPVIVKVSELVELTALATGDLLEVVDVSEAPAADKTKKIQAGNLKLFNADQVGAGIITQVKMAANSVDSDQYVDGSIDQEHLSVGASKVTNRQGGDATDWFLPGTTNYAITSARIQIGAIYTLSTGAVTVTFPVAFSGAPMLYVTCNGAVTGQYIVWGSIAAGSFAVSLYNAAGSRINGSIQWLAIGPA